MSDPRVVTNPPWTPEPRTFATWGIETLGATPRITEDAAWVRITEQGNVRIIEFKQITWNLEGTTYNPWTLEIIGNAFDDNAFDPRAFE